MTDREKLIELLEEVPAHQRLYPDLYVDYLIENGVTIIKNGYWIDTGFENSTGPILRCSQCSHIHNPNKEDLELERVELKPLYCDACGQKMYSEEDEGKEEDKNKNNEALLDEVCIFPNGFGYIQPLLELHFEGEYKI